MSTTTAPGAKLGYADRIIVGLHLQSIQQEAERLARCEPLYAGLADNIRCSASSITRRLGLEEGGR